jgi:hypothetical protein
LYRQQALRHEWRAEYWAGDVANGSVRDAVAAGLNGAVNFLRQQEWEISERRCNTSVVSGADTIHTLGYAAGFQGAFE